MAEIMQENMGAGQAPIKKNIITDCRSNNWNGVLFELLNKVILAAEQASSKTVNLGLFGPR